jgi:hypothetical protein
MSYPHLSAECAKHHGLVKDFNGPRPEIVTLCGSTKFADEFAAVNRELTLQGYLVISVGVFGMSGVDNADDVKLALDELHKRKIDLADYVYVVNPGGYIGHSTRNEITYARSRGIEVSYLVPPAQIAPGLRNLVDGSEGPS